MVYIVKKMNLQKFCKLGHQLARLITSWSSLYIWNQYKAMFFLPLRLRHFFAWDYHEMLGLDKKLVEHRFPFKE